MLYHNVNCTFCYFCMYTTLNSHAIAESIKDERGRHNLRNNIILSSFLFKYLWYIPSWKDSEMFKTK